MNENCLFCKLISGKLPIAAKIYEDADTLAFLDISPINVGHTLVVPKVHYHNIHDTPASIFESVMKTVHKLSPSIMSAVHAGGINIGINNESVAGQVVPHLHVHIIPRFPDDGLSAWSNKPYVDDEISKVASAILDVLNQ